MPQVVNPETITETCASTGGHERDESPVGQPHDAPAGHGEHEIIGALAVNTRRQLDGDKPRERDGPGWHGEIYERTEGGVFVYTCRDQVPCISTRTITDGNPEYLAWIARETAPGE